MGKLVRCGDPHFSATPEPDIEADCQFSDCQNQAPPEWDKWDAPHSALPEDPLDLITPFEDGPWLHL